MKTKTLNEELDRYEAIQHELKVREVVRNTKYNYGKRWILHLNTYFRVRCLKCRSKSHRLIEKIEIRLRKKNIPELAHFFCDDCYSKSTGRCSIPISRLIFTD